MNPYDFSPLLNHPRRNLLKSAGGILLASSLPYASAFAAEQAKASKPKAQTP